MPWEDPYIHVRVDEHGVAKIVHAAKSTKDARYWLQYIALAGDAIFTTPSHPQYAGNGTPVYMAHLVARGKIEYSEEGWKRQVLSEGQAVQIPEQSGA